MKKYSTEDLIEILEEVGESSYDGKCRAVSDSSEVEADGEMWAVISDHGNAQICYKGRNGRMYWVGGLV
jgi:hypothetical protein